MTIHEAITLNNRLRAINYATNIADRPSYAAALDLCKILGRDIEPDSDLRSRAILTEAGKVDALSRYWWIITSPLLIGLRTSSRSVS